MCPQRDLQVNLDEPEAGVVRLASRVILEGGVVLGPTDTIYGFACRALDTAGLQRIVRLKGRAPEKGFLVLISDLGWVSRLGEQVSPEIFEALGRLWPAPVTVLLAARPELPRLLRGESDKVGLRWPRLPFLERWLQAVGQPLVSTSANRSGEPYSGDPVKLRSTFAGKVDLFLEARPPLPENPPSTVVDLSGVRPVVVRKGAGWEKVTQVLQF